MVNDVEYTVLDCVLNVLNNGVNILDQGGFSPCLRATVLNLLKCSINIDIDVKST